MHIVNSLYVAFENESETFACDYDSQAFGVGVKDESTVETNFSKPCHIRSFSAMKKFLSVLSHAESNTAAALHSFMKPTGFNQSWSVIPNSI